MAPEKEQNEKVQTDRPKGVSLQPVEHNAEIIDIHYLSDTLAKFRIRPGDGLTKDFTPGQYLTVGDNNPVGSTRRAYSIASPPHEQRWYELFIRRVSEENAQSAYPLTHILFDRKPGDGVWIGPKVAGHFTLAHTIKPDDPRLRIFVAAGTGLAPFVSIVQSALHGSNNGDIPPHLILHGCSYPHELGYKEDLENAMKAMQKLGYIPTISRPHEASDWEGETGRVETFFDGERLDDLEIRLGQKPGFLTPDNAVIYICGLQGTIANTLRSLIDRGFVPASRSLRKHMGIPAEFSSSLFFEQYDATPILELEEAQELGKILLG